MHAWKLNPFAIFVIVILVVSFFALYMRGETRALSLGETLSNGIHLAKGESFKSSIIVDRITPKIRIRFISSGNVRLTLGSFEGSCSATTCVFIIDPVIESNRLDIVFEALSATEIKSVEIQVVKYKLDTTLNKFNSRDWSIIGGLLFLALLINGLLYEKQKIVQWTIIIFVLIFLVYNDYLFTVCLLAYLAAIYSIRNQVNTTKKRQLLSFVILTSVAFLLFFKYGKETIYSLFANPGGFDLLMPIGVSYFVIRIIDTQLKWYRKDCVSVTFREFLFFVVFPGTLIAGPIEDIKHFYANRRHRLLSNDVSYGIARIIIGVFKKVVIADGFLFQVMHGNRLTGVLWQDSGSSVNLIATDPAAALGSDVFAFALSGLLFAYIDFSAYSDMAIGLSRLFGYRIRENFNFPILASNIREYWKRWHISLSDWSFRNIYFPVLIKTQNSYLPLYLTMFSIGLWHAFNLSWFSWAIHHATGMMVVDIAQKHLKLKPVILTLLRPVRTGITIIYASMGFVFVYFSDYLIAVELYTKLWKWLFGWVVV